MSSKSNSSILSFPDRGPWGSSKYRGNCSGHVYASLFESFQPATFCDPMMGSGTSIEVAREMGIEAFGLDLRLGFNCLTDSILQQVGKPVDLCVSHPPYGEMIRYSGAGNVWGTEPHPDDLSWCLSDEDFHAKLQAVLMNQREATRPGGHYGTIIGDLRKNGRYVSFQAEAIARMPSDELAAVLIKQQFNCVSDTRQYAKMTMPRIMHEYVLLWKRSSRSLFGVLKVVATSAQARLRNTWRSVIRLAMINLGGKAQLQDLYRTIAANAPENVSANQNWQAAVRRTLQECTDLFAPVERGVWAMKPAS